MTESTNGAQVEQLSAKQQLAGMIAGLSGLAEVEQKISSKLVSEAPLLEEIPDYLLRLGGKRMRPVLTLLTAKAFGMKSPSPALIDVAAGIELIHMATLLHDDIIDKSPLRRHQDSAFIRYGLSQTLLAGDFLLVRAFSLCAHLDTFIIDATEQACIELTEGEILETNLFEQEHSLDSSLTIARKKTAALFRLSAESAAHLCDLPGPAVKKLAEFGEYLGIAFQVLDDLLDVVADQDLLGKESGTDLRERKPSVVNVLWLASGDARAQRLRTAPNGSEREFIDEALNVLRDGPIVKEVRNLAHNFAKQAEQALHEARDLCGDSRCDTTAFDGLQAIINFTVERMM